MKYEKHATYLVHSSIKHFGLGYRVIKFDFSAVLWLYWNDFKLTWDVYTWLAIDLTCNDLEMTCKQV